MPHSTIEHHAEVNGSKVPVIELEVINYARILDQDPNEIEKLLSAASMPGFFHLDLHDEPTGEFLPCLQETYAISAEYFTPNESQQMFEIKRDAVLSKTQTFPNPLTPHADKLTHFTHLTNTINRTLLNALSTSLSLPHLSSAHTDALPSDTALNLIYSPSKPLLSSAPDTTHTDMGTITSLFCERWGIQIEHPETKQWGFVRPKEGCALVNGADWLAGNSEGRLVSCRHRHTQATDGFQERYFVVAYLRPGRVEEEAI